MGTLLARDVIKKAQRRLVDLNALSWPMDELLDFLNEAQRAVVVLRPDAKSDVVEYTLQAGTRQTLPAGSVRLLDVRCNVDGPSCTYVERSNMDSYSRSWRTATANAEVRHWMYDDRVPQEFDVYPPQPASSFGAVELVRSLLPTDCTLSGVNGGSVDSTIDVSDVFEMALQDYLVYRCYSKDSTYTAPGGKADQAYQKYLQGLGFGLTTDRKFNPRTNAPPHVSQQQPSEGAF